jgi:hypothetical protein
MGVFELTQNKTPQKKRKKKERGIFFPISTPNFFK